MNYKAVSNNIKQVGENEAKDDNRYYFEAEVSSNAIDCQYERMTMKTLRNFEKALKTSKIVLKDSHMRSNGIGHATDGWLKDDHLYAKFSMPIDRPLGADYSYPNTKHFVDAIKDGDINMTSVGFLHKDSICSICNEKSDNGWLSSIFGAPCGHQPGKEYDVEVSKDVTEKQLCVMDLDGCTLSEVSLVYQGANPEAYITEKIKSGSLNPKELEVLKKAFGSQIDATNNKTIFDGGHTMSDNEKILQTENESLKSALDTITKDRDELKSRNDNLETKIEEMTPAYERGKAIGSATQDRVVQKYKTIRTSGEDSLEGDGLKIEIDKFSKRLTSMDYEELVYEEKYLDRKLEDVKSREDEKEVKTGEKVTSNETREDKPEDGETILE